MSSTNSDKDFRGVTTLFKVAVVILNWNKARATVSCAESVLRAFSAASSDLVAPELIIVDNGSSEDIDLLHDWCTNDLQVKVCLLRNPCNLGFAGGMNVGVRKALAIKPDFIWLLNNDVLVARNSISNLIRFSRTATSAAITGSTVLDPTSGRVVTAGGYKYYSWLGLNLPVFAGLSLSELTLKNVPRLDYIDGAALWFRGDFLARLGQLPENHFMYFEELELMDCLANDEKIAWCRDAVISHGVGGSSPSSELKERATYHAALSAFNYTKNNHPWRLPSVIFARFIAASFRSLVWRQPKILGATMNAFMDFYFSS